MGTPAEIAAGTSALLSTAVSGREAVITVILAAAALARADANAPSDVEVAWVAYNMPSLDAGILANQGPAAANSAMVAAILALAEFARANPDQAVPPPPPVVPDDSGDTTDQGD